MDPNPDQAAPAPAQASRPRFRPANSDELKAAVDAYIAGDRRHGPIGTWDVSQVTDMSGLFEDQFNEDISDWDTSRVTDMSGMFSSATFNQDISNWDTSSVTTMSHMFEYTENFNQPLNTHTVTRKDGAIKRGILVVLRYENFNDKAFNQPLNNWNVSNVTDMREMFNCAYSFNQPLNNWNVSNVTDMEECLVVHTLLINHK